MKKYLFGIPLVLILCAIGWYFYIASQYDPISYIETPSTNPVLKATSTISFDANGNKIVTEGAPSFTLLEVSNHKDRSSCYSVINGVVYDLTTWINLHPGGQGEILSICGVDGTKPFMSEHKGRAKFMKILEHYQIGLLK